MLMLELGRFVINAVLIDNDTKWKVRCYEHVTGKFDEWKIDHRQMGCFLAVFIARDTLPMSYGEITIAATAAVAGWTTKPLH